MATDENTGLVFVIDDQEYTAPGLDELDMQERRVLYDLAGVIQEDFMREEDEDDAEHEARIRRLMRPPGFMEALMHIAYARANPRLSREKVQAVIDRTNFMEAIAKWGDESGAADDDVPLPVTNEPEPPSQKENGLPNRASGKGSTPGTDLPDGIRAPIGTLSSGTFSLGAAPTRSDS